MKRLVTAAMNVVDTDLAFKIHSFDSNEVRVAKIDAAARVAVALIQAESMRLTS